MNLYRAQVRLIKRRSATPTIWTGEFILTAVGVAIVVVAYLWISTDDYTQQQRLEQPMQHVAAQVSEKGMAHQRAQELRDKGLLDDANKMMYPCCQAKTSK